ncbi:DUF1611 domain-containing protein [bacterium]|nr:DUF1611 domain-containing protein [bacterium]MBU1937688.1 DUF1611 domain-containing protein [bacterium]
MSGFDGNAIVYCQGAFNTTNGKTAHGLVRFTRRYKVVSVVDSRYAGKDAGEVLDGRKNNIPIHATIEDAVTAAKKGKLPVTHLVVGLAPDGGRLSTEARSDIQAAIRLGLNVDCGLHDYLNDDSIMAALASNYGVTLRDVRKPLPIDAMHSFSGKIEQVTSFKIAMLGTDSAVGKRTTAWLLVKGYEEIGRKVEMIGTGQTSWMQGVRYGIILDTLINDFLAGEIEHAVWSAWNEVRPDVIIIEGQGSLLNPAYPGGYEILAAARPDVVVLQYVPTRKDYDGFPGYRIHDLSKQIQAVEMISDKPVVAISLNHENIPAEDIHKTCERIERETGLPTSDVLIDGPQKIVVALMEAEKQIKRK